MALPDLRYAIDKRLVPTGLGTSHGRGIARTFSPCQAFGLLVAHSLVKAGMNRFLTRACLQKLGRPPADGAGETSPLDRAYRHDGASLLQVADGLFARVEAKKGRQSAAFVTDWVYLPGGAPKKKGDDKKAVVMLAVHLRALRGRIVDFGEVREEATFRKIMGTSSGPRRHPGP